MRLWIFVLIATGCSSAHHNEFHQTDAFAIQNEPQQSFAYAIPVQIYSAHSTAAPAADIYTAPAPAIYILSSNPQLYAATISPVNQVYSAVTPAPQFSVHNVEVQSYSVPTYSAQTYSAPSYSAQSYSSPTYSSKSYSSESYSPPSYSTKSYSPPSYSSKSYSAPSQHAQSYSTSKYKAPATSFSTQYKSPIKSYQKPSYPAIAKTSYSPPVKSVSAPHFSTVHFKAPTAQHHTSAVQYQSSTSDQYRTSSYVKPVAILRQSQDDSFDGSFSYEFQAENGIASSANGYVKHLTPKEQAQVIQGQYSYTAPDGTPVVTRWYADETGFHAEGAHLPVTPPVPVAIAKSLAYQGAY